MASYKKLRQENLMGNTLPTALEILLNYEQSFGRFRRALRRGDQRFG